jgi:hypothetical protein
MDAIQYAASYDGKFGFMLDMKARVQRGWTLSAAQYAAIERCAARDAERTTSQPADPVTETGMYRAGADVFKVQRGKDSGALYAKKLISHNGDRLMESGDVKRVEFEYAPGWVRSLSAANRMTVDEAKALSIRFGFCVVCGAFLKDAKSVARGIGPICIKNI